MGFGKISPIIMSIFNKEYSANDKLKMFLVKRDLEFVKLFAYGKSSWLILTKKEGIYYTIKQEKINSTRTDMVEKETRHLKLANTINIGPKLIDYDNNSRTLLWKYIEGTPLKLWVEFANKTQLKRCVIECLSMSKKLDELGLDHGQLAGEGTNIIVSKEGTPTIMDFEKSSNNRKTHNYNTVTNFFFTLKNEISEKIKELNLTSLKYASNNIL